MRKCEQNVNFFLSKFQISRLAVYKKMLDCYVGLKDFNRARLTLSVLSKMTNNEAERTKLQMMLSKIPENVKFKSVLPAAIEGDTYCDLYQ